MDAKEQKPESYTYAKAGVSIETGNALVRAIAPLALRHRLRRNPMDEAGSSVRVERALAELCPA